MFNKLCPELENVLAVTASALNGSKKKWLLGGSCGLLLQGVELQNPPRDIDIYVDEENASELHSLLDVWSTDAQQLDQCGMYSSILSHYVIHNYAVELVGDFQIFSGASHYRVQIDRLLYNRSVSAAAAGVTLQLMPLSHELVFNVLRDRPNRFEAIARTIKEHPDQRLPLLQEIIEQFALNSRHRQQILSLVNTETLQQ